jgi:O-antigen ligase
VLWTWHRLAISEEQPYIPQPIRRAAFFFVAALVASFAAGMTRPINADELQVSQLTLLVAFGWLGILLMAADGITSKHRFDVLIRRLTLAAGLFAALGLAQFFTGMQLTNYIVVPGLSANQALSELAGRDGFNRPASTAIHPIEFGVAITCLLPLCLHVALYSRHTGAVRRWLPVAAIALAIPLSISRSAIVGAAVSLVVLIPTWPGRLRAYAVVCLGGLGAAVFVFLPGVIGTLTGLFSGAATDPSALSRTDSYGLAGQFIAQAPIFGRGFGTFLPRYRILDNQYLLLTIETGVVGVVALLGLFVTALVGMLLVRRRLTDPKERDLSQALIASVASAAVGYALFDAFAFPIFASLTFLLVGLCGAWWRLNATSAQLWIR